MSAIADRQLLSLVEKAVTNARINANNANNTVQYLRMQVAALESTVASLRNELGVLYSNQDILSERLADLENKLKGG